MKPILSVLPIRGVGLESTRPLNSHPRSFFFSVKRGSKYLGGKGPRQDLGGTRYVTPMFLPTPNEE